MRKLSSLAFNWITASIMIILLVIAWICVYQNNKMEPGNGSMQLVEFKERIHIEILARDYMENHEYLLRAEIDGEQVGIVYFDENGEIRFDGDKERFEYALYRAFKLRGYGKEEK